LRPKSLAVNSVTASAKPSSRVAASNAVTAALISPSNWPWRWSWSSPWVSKPPMPQKKHWRDSDSRPRAPINLATICNCRPRSLPGNSVVSCEEAMALVRMRWLSIERPMVDSQVCSNGSARCSASRLVMAVDRGSLPAGL
jgi:hypothetical protein